MMNLPIRLPIFAGAILATLSLGASAYAEPDLNHINFKTTVGSFKLLGADKPAHGTLEIHFTGTVLVSGLTTGTITPSGSVALELENKPHNKKVYHGTGTLIINGEFQAVQFFGQNLTGKFTGLGILRFYGEFDKNLETGEYWYDGGDHSDWGTGGAQATVPGFKRPTFSPGGGPRVKVKGGAKIGS